MTAQACPVCNGRGLVAEDFYVVPPRCTLMTYVPVQCRTCAGRGAVAVEGLPVVGGPLPQDRPQFWWGAVPPSEGDTCPAAEITTWPGDAGSGDTIRVAP